ncbi:MAG: hypothetical protein IJU76_09780 [Desulfovibrionaceae bacterium]|nr:hypothetical protein [Desulfovibrionaceae bacterium]
MPSLRILVFCLLLLSLGCSKSPDNSRISIEATDDFATPFQIQIDNHVRRQPPAISIRPQGQATHRPRAVFLPFRMTQQINGADSFSRLLSRQIWNIMLSQSIFHTLEFVETRAPYTPSTAISVGRSKGAELAVGGYIHHYFDGGATGPSTLSIALEIYDVRSGVLLWSMAQGGMLEARQSHDFYLFAVKERNPDDPAGLIVRSLAWDMSQILLAWVNPGAARKAAKKETSTILSGSGY